MTYTKKMHNALRRDTQGKKNQVTDLLDEIERLEEEVIGFPFKEGCLLADISQKETTIKELKEAVSFLLDDVRHRLGEYEDDPFYMEKYRKLVKE